MNINSKIQMLFDEPTDPVQRPSHADHHLKLKQISILKVHVILGTFPSLQNQLDHWCSNLSPKII